MDLALSCSLTPGDLSRVRETHLAHDELTIWREFLPTSILRDLQAAAERLRPHVCRKYVPRYKRSGSVCAYDVRRHAPEVEALYRDPDLVGFLSTLAGAALEPCPARDPHACALYYYTEPGDHIGWHFDASHYAGARYTVLLGIVNRTQSSRLECQLFKKDRSRAPVPLSVDTDPGMLVFFNGDRLWHSVSALGADEERIVLTFEYVTNPHMTVARRALSDLKDAFTYFGFQRMFARQP